MSSESRSTYGHSALILFSTLKYAYIFLVDMYIYILASGAQLRYGRTKCRHLDHLG